MKPKRIFTFYHFLIFSFFITAVPMLLACSNEDVPVPEEDMAIPGASSVTVADLDGTWRCAKTDKENFIPKGFQMTIQNGKVTQAIGKSLYIARGPIRIDGNKIKMGSDKQFNFSFSNDDFHLIYKTEYHKFSFSFKKIN